MRKTVLWGVALAAAILQGAAKAHAWPMMKEKLERSANGDGTTTFSLTFTTNGTRLYLR